MEGARIAANPGIAATSNSDHRHNRAVTRALPIMAEKSHSQPKAGNALLS